jgi:hypothetical protein
MRKLMLCLTFLLVGSYSNANTDTETYNQLVSNLIPIQKSTTKAELSEKLEKLKKAMDDRAAVVAGMNNIHPDIVANVTELSIAIDSIQLKNLTSGSCKNIINHLNQKFSTAKYTATVKTADWIHQVVLRINYQICYKLHPEAIKDIKPEATDS